MLDVGFTHKDWNYIEKLDPTWFFTKNFIALFGMGEVFRYFYHKKKS